MITNPINGIHYSSHIHYSRLQTSPSENCHRLTSINTKISHMSPASNLKSIDCCVEPKNLLTRFSRSSDDGKRGKKSRSRYFSPWARKKTERESFRSSPSSFSRSDQIRDSMSWSLDRRRKALGQISIKRNWLSTLPSIVWRFVFSFVFYSQSNLSSRILLFKLVQSLHRLIKTTTSTLNESRNINGNESTEENRFSLTESFQNPRGARVESKIFTYFTEGILVLLFFSFSVQYVCKYSSHTYLPLEDLIRCTSWSWPSWRQICDKRKFSRHPFVLPAVFFLGRKIVLVELRAQHSVSRTRNNACD